MAGLLAQGQRKTDRRGLLLALPLALLTHGLMLLAFIGYGSLTARPPRPVKPVNRPVSLRRIDSKAWASNRGRLSPPEREAPLHPKGQVVDVAPGNQQVPTESKYLAMDNNTVKQETRAKEQTNKYSRATAATQAKPEASPAKKGKPAPLAPPPPSGIDLSQSMLGRAAPTLLPSQVRGTSSELQPSTEAPGTETGSQATPGGDQEGGGAPNDDLNNLPEGQGTFLNTREWKYAAFFNRIKQAVSTKWDPNSRLREKGRGLGVDRLTVLNVTLRPDGTLADVFVSQSCGLEALDVEAMNAFTKAQPFSNPPAALVEQGFIRFAFSFHVSNEGMAMPLPLRFR